MKNNKYNEMRIEAINDIIETLDNGFDGYYADLHNEVFNTSYYIIGTCKAKEALKEFDVFEAIEKVMEYEKFNFGEVTTEIHNPEKLVNMLYYIIGEEIISEMNDIEAFSEGWNEYADDETNVVIIEEIKKLFENELN